MIIRLYPCAEQRREYRNYNDIVIFLQNGIIQVYILDKAHCICTAFALHLHRFSSVFPIQYLFLFFCNTFFCGDGYKPLYLRGFSVLGMVKTWRILSILLIL